MALAFRREIEQAADPEARRRELEDEIAAAQSVFPRAEDFGVHDLIDPRSTRPLLCDWVQQVEPQLALLRGPPPGSPLLRLPLLASGVRFLHLLAALRLFSAATLLGLLLLADPPESRLYRPNLL